VGITVDEWDSGRPTSEPWDRFPVAAVLEGCTPRHGHPGKDWWTVEIVEVWSYLGVGGV